MKRDLSEILVNFVSVFRFRFGCRAVLLATNVCLSRCLTFLVMSRVVWQCSGEWKSAKSELVLLPSSRWWEFTWVHWLRELEVLGSVAMSAGEWENWEAAVSFSECVSTSCVTTTNKIMMMMTMLILAVNPWLWSGRFALWRCPWVCVFPSALYASRLGRDDRWECGCFGRRDGQTSVHVCVTPPRQRSR